MLNWFWRRLGYHICDEFTRWTTRECVVRRAPTYDEFLLADIKTLVEVRVRFQERECTICGKAQQRHLH